MKEGVDFSYAGIQSQFMGLLNVSLSSGMFEEQFVSPREIREVKVRGREKPYFQGIERSPLVLSLSFAFENSYDESKIREVARWLDQEYYQPFFTSDNSNRIFYCVLHSEPKLLHNGLKQGYVEIEMRCDSPYSYSPQYTPAEYDFSSNGVSGTVIDFVNYGDVICKPEIWITKVGNGEVKIVNTTNQGKEFKFINLLDTEELYIDCENEHIESELPSVIPGGDPTIQYRYSDFNNNYLETVRGVNKLTVYGNCKLKFRYQFKTLQG